MPTTEKQFQANRQNALKSTGPRTDAGKQTSSRNALKHGILAREAVIAHPDYHESQDEFETLLTQLHDDWRPEGPREELLLQQIATCYWRLRRILQVDSLEFGKTLAQFQEPADTMDSLGKTVTLYPPSLPPTERLDLILRYEKSLTQQLYRAMKELDHLQQQRRQAPTSPPPSIQPPEDPPSHSYTSTLPRTESADPSVAAPLLVNAGIVPPSSARAGGEGFAKRTHCSACRRSDSPPDPANRTHFPLILRSLSSRDRAGLPARQPLERLGGTIHRPSPPVPSSIAADTGLSWRFRAMVTQSAPLPLMESETSSDQCHPRPH